MSISRKMFAGRITIPPMVATSLISMMQSSALHWGLEADLITPSMDSITGSECGIIPDGNIYIGIDANVFGPGAVSPQYQGVFVASGVNYQLNDFGPAFGMIDPNQIWIYMQSGGGADLVFQAR